MPQPQTLLPDSTLTRFLAVTTASTGDAVVVLEPGEPIRTRILTLAHNARASASRKEPCNVLEQPPASRTAS